MSNLPVYIGRDAIQKFIEYCQQERVERFNLIADQNTYRVLGHQVELSLKKAKINQTTIILQGQEVLANEAALTQGLLNADREAQLYLAIGSGTITDITRIVSHRTKSPFVSMPTAPSVDGFASIGAPLVVGGLKHTYIAQPPLAIFAEIETLCEAPKRLIAAGFGDMMGKFTSQADWQLGHLLWKEPFDSQIVQRSRKSAEVCTRHAQEIGEREKEGIYALMNELVDSGKCMLDFGNSTPASGAEHHLSHYWEMKFLRERKSPILHGLAVGFATILIAELYEKVKQITSQQLIQHLPSVSLRNQNQEIQNIAASYGPLKDTILQVQKPFLNLTPASFEELKEKLINVWGDIQAIANSVPSPTQIRHWLQLAGSPTEAENLGLHEAEVKLALNASHYLRNRFTVTKLFHLFDLH